MFYRKNVGTKERVARGLAGALMALWGLVGLHASPLGLVVVGAGIMAVATGVIGFCPACAMVGRKPIDPA